MTRRLLLFVIIAAACVVPQRSDAEDPQNSEAAAWDAAAETLVVFNPSDPESGALAHHYAVQRGIPADRVLGLPCPKSETMTRSEFESTLRRPLLDALDHRGWWKFESREIKPSSDDATRQARVVTESKIKIVALIRGIPFRIQRESQKPRQTKEDEASVDSELACLGMPAAPIAGAIQNPCFQKLERFNLVKGAEGMLLVARLDAPDAATVRRMIDDTIATEKAGLRGRAVIDLAQRNGGYQAGENWLHTCFDLYRNAGIPVWMDNEGPLIPENWPLPDTALYFGWYAENVSGALASPTFRFKRGAIACHLHSFSAAALRDKTRNWVGPLLDHGAAAALGNVYEPYLELTVHFDILNDRLLKGWTLAEAAWAAHPAVSWMNVVVGDPLYRPFASTHGASLGEPGNDRDYALYQGMVRRHGINHSKDIKHDLLELAESRENAHLLELIALLSATEKRHAEAADLFEHASSLAKPAAVRLRLRLYQAHERIQEGDRKQAAAILRSLQADPDFKSLPAMQAATTLLGQLAQ